MGREEESGGRKERKKREGNKWRNERTVRREKEGSGGVKEGRR